MTERTYGSCNESLMQCLDCGSSRVHDLAAHIRELEAEVADLKLLCQQQVEANIQQANEFAADRRTLALRVADVVETAIQQAVIAAYESEDGEAEYDLAAIVEQELAE